MQGKRWGLVDFVAPLEDPDIQGPRPSEALQNCESAAAGGKDAIAFLEGLSKVYHKGAQT